jgi:hypothetical protein
MPRLVQFPATDAHRSRRWQGARRNAADFPVVRQLIGTVAERIGDESLNRMDSGFVHPTSSWIFCGDHKMLNRIKAIRTSSIEAASASWWAV